MKHSKDAKFTDKDGSVKYWVRVRFEGEGDAKQCYWFCCVCNKYLGHDGVKGPRWNNLVANNGALVTRSTGADALRTHTNHEASDHKRALEAMRGKAREKEPTENAAKHEDDRNYRASRRAKHHIPDEVLSVITFAYACMVLPMSSRSFQTISRVAGGVGARFPDMQHYQNKDFFKDLVLDFDLIRWENAIQAFKAATMISVHVDGADGFFLIRVGFLTADLQGTTMFWQARHLASKTAEACFQGLRNAFIELPHKSLNKWYHITETEWMQKLCAVVGDGATDLGLRANGKGVEEICYSLSPVHPLPWGCHGGPLGCLRAYNKLFDIMKRQISSKWVSNTEPAHKRGLLARSVTWRSAPNPPSLGRD